jgi:hypothetical protein
MYDLDSRVPEPPIWLLRKPGFNLEGWNAYWHRILDEQDAWDVQHWRDGRTL